MKKILLVEDDPNIVSSLTLFMKNEGYLVDSANGQQTALQKIAQEQYDIILLDISLNDGNGFSTCSAIKSQKDIPIIFLTADDDEFSVVSGLELGADDYICKPFRPRELLARINTVLRQKKWKSEFLSCKDITVDVQKAVVRKGNTELILSGRVFRCRNRRRTPRPQRQGARPRPSATLPRSGHRARPVSLQRHHHPPAKRSDRCCR